MKKALTKTLATLLTLSLALLPALFVSTTAFAQSAATDTMKAAVDNIVVIVNEKEFSSSENKRAAILNEVKGVFDFSEMAKRSLGANWKKVSQEEQSEFVDAFSDFLADTYINRVDQVKPGMIEFNDEKIKGNKALVKTSIMIDEETFPLDYKMYNEDGKWMVYDVIIENVGLISNYRNEFAGIMRKEKFAGLMRRLKKKQEAAS